MAYEIEKQVAVKAALAAGRLCDLVRKEISPEAIEKKDRSPVTIADFGAQALICRELATAFPADPVVGEEDAAELKQPELADRLAQVTNYVQASVPEATSEQVLDWIDHGNGSVAPRYWTLDPIDGTKGFLRGDQYAVALALIEDGEVKLGVLVCPALQFKAPKPGLMFVAVRGEGTLMVDLDQQNSTPVQVVSADDTEHLRFVESVEHGDKTLQSAIAQAAGITQESLRMDSQAKYGAVASGEAALYLRLPSPKYPNYQEKIWDHAAGVIVVEEAGGCVTDMYGKPLDFSQSAKLINNRGVIVSNGTVHDKVLEALKQPV